MLPLTLVALTPDQVASLNALPTLVEQLRLIVASAPPGGLPPAPVTPQTTGATPADPVKPRKTATKAEKVQLPPEPAEAPAAPIVEAKVEPAPVAEVAKAAAPAEKPLDVADLRGPAVELARLMGGNAAVLPFMAEAGGTSLSTIPVEKRAGFVAAVKAKIASLATAAGAGV